MVYDRPVAYQDIFSLAISCREIIFYSTSQLNLLVVRSVCLFIAEKQEIATGKSDLNSLIGTAVFFRLAFLFSVPTLLDDYFRFIWDGEMWNREKILIPSYHHFKFYSVIRPIPT
jgi:hypothetical protein